MEGESTETIHLDEQAFHDVLDVFEHAEENAVTTRERRELKELRREIQRQYQE